MRMFWQFGWSLEFTKHLNIARQLRSIALVGIFVASLTVFAQNISSPPVERDAKSVATLEQALQALGGNSVWRNVQETDVEGTTNANKGPSMIFHWKDNWSDKSHHLERTGPDMQNRPKHFTEDKESDAQGVTQNKAQRFQRPAADSVALLLVHMPGAAIARILRDSRYGIESSTSSPFLSPAVCVSVYRDRGNIVHGGLQAILCFDRKTLLPIRATIMLANLAVQGTTSPERIEYKGFQQVETVVVPRTVTVINPLGMPREYTFSSVRTNLSSSEARGR